MENIENIFEGAKFGDKFLTRDGSIALYIRHIDNHKLYSKKGWINCDDSGKYMGLYYELPLADIVSRYKEPIDEEKLEIFAEELAQELIAEPTGWIEELQRPELSYRDLKDAIKESYRKAKNEQN